MIRDSNIERGRKSVFIPAASFSDIGIAAVATGKIGNGAGTVVLEPIGATSYFGADFSTVALPTALRTYLPIPEDLDRSEDIQLRLLFTTGSADVADTIDWTVTYEHRTNNGAAFTNTVNDVLDTVIPQVNATAAPFTIQATPAGKINGNKIPVGADCLLLQVELTAIGLGLAEQVMLTGVEMRYCPHISDKVFSDTFTKAYDPRPWS